MVKKKNLFKMFDKTEMLPLPPKREKKKRTHSCPPGVVRGWPADRQRLPSLPSLPAVLCCVDGLVLPSTHFLVFKVTLKVFSSVTLLYIKKSWLN